MGFLIGFLSIAFVITIIVVFHEFGHYITAKKSGILVREFSVGFGPLLLGKKYGETLYAIRPIPLGGYVDLAGMDEKEELEDPNRAFYNKNPWIKTIILFAGSFMNFVLAFLIYWIIFSGYGLKQKPYYMIPVVSKIIPNSPAYEVGLRPYDKIIAIDSKTISENDWYDFRNYVRTKANQNVNLVIERDGHQLQFNITVKEDPKTKNGYIGIIADTIAEIGEVIPESPAFKLKLQSGDVIKKINNHDIKYFSEVNDLLKKYEGKEVEFIVLRDTTELKLKAKIDFAEHFGIMPPLMPIIGEVMGGMPADNAGLKSSDQVIRINGQDIKTWSQMLSIVSKNPGNELHFVVLRGENKEIFETKVIPKYDPSAKAGRIGISIKNIVDEKLGIVEGAVYAFNQVITIMVEMMRGLKKLILGAISMDYVQGPVGIAKTVKDQALEGFASLLNITALISINIGIINLFPIPGLDGGRMVFTFIEIIRRKRLSTEVEEKIHAVGIVLLILLAILVTYKDIVRLIWS